MQASEVQQFIRDNKVAIIDMKFADPLGTWQHMSVTTSEFTDSVFSDGIGFDGSSIRLFQGIEESDMILIPDPATAFLDPFMAHATLHIIADVRDPVTGEPYHKDPRGVAKRAEAYLKRTGIADTSYWGPELEFFVFDEVRYGQDQNSAFFIVDSAEGWWNTGTEPADGANLGYKTPYKAGYFPTPPRDTQQDLRTEMVLTLERAGVQVEIHHHEVATAGQAEIDMKYDTLVRMADNVQLYKYVVRNVARQAGKVATFMPKPLFDDNASGMHTHQSLWKDGSNLFYDANGYALASEMSRHYTGGLFKHAAALMAFCAPTTNSYKRLVPGFEAPVNLVYSARNRSAAVRIPMYSSSPASKRLEFRPPDPTANPYLAFAAMLLAGLDGIQNKIDPGEPLEKDIYELDPETAAAIDTVPGSLEEALSALEQDHQFLLAGDVFPEDLIQGWIRYKRENEVDPVRMRPHPYEFALYFDA